VDSRPVAKLQPFSRVEFRTLAAGLNPVLVLVHRGSD
jgi:hypothetical protein